MVQFNNLSNCFKVNKKGDCICVNYPKNNFVRSDFSFALFMDFDDFMFSSFSCLSEYTAIVALDFANSFVLFNTFFFTIYKFWYSSSFFERLFVSLCSYCAVSCKLSEQITQNFVLFFYHRTKLNKFLWLYPSPLFNLQQFVTIKSFGTCQSSCLTDLQEVCALGVCFTYSFTAGIIIASRSCGFAD